MSMVKIITIPFQDSLQSFDDERLRRFVDSRKVLSLREFFFLKDGCPYLVFVITYESDLIQNNQSSQTIKSHQKSDESWKKLLSDKDLPLFDTLREWIKNQAETEGVPPYIVFTNKELATLVSKKVRFTLSDRIFNLSLDIAEKIVEAKYQRKKTITLNHINLSLEKIRVLFRNAHEGKFVSSKDFYRINEVLFEGPDNRNNDLGFRLVSTLILPEKVVYGLLSRAQGFVQTIILRCPIKGQTKKFGLFLLIAN